MSSWGDEPTTTTPKVDGVYTGYGSIHDLVTCPYDSSHQVGASKFPNHLVRCRKQHPELAREMDICPYNQTHHVLKEDMILHLNVCEEYKSHQYHAINTCQPRNFPEFLSKPSAATFKRDFGPSREDKEAREKLLQDINSKMFNQRDLDDWGVREKKTGK